MARQPGDFVHWLLVDAGFKKRLLPLTSKPYQVAIEENVAVPFAPGEWRSRVKASNERH
ncbi:MAG: hypothetical protein AAF514_06740 [Verrucomicrobiota bacterium]